MPPDPDSPLVTREQLADALGRAGVRSGDVLYVHSSLRSLGRMDGGAEGAVDALVAAVGPDGHLAVPTHSGNLADRLADNGPFDPPASPSRTGAITEALRRRPGAFRSNHPTHSVAAVGPRAQRLVAGHCPTGDTLSLAGPHGRLVRWNARIVFLGVGLNSNTTFHAAENWLEYPYMPDRRVAILGPDGRPRIVTTRFAPSGHRNFYRRQPVRPPVDWLQGRGLIRLTRLNATEIRLVRARDVIRETCMMERERPACTLCDDPACEFCSAGRRLCIRDRERILARADWILAQPALCDPAAPANHSA